MSSKKSFLNIVQSCDILKIVLSREIVFISCEKIYNEDI